ncbi:MAG: glycogen/starch synthase [Bacteroidia bacterium]|nr:glycogen/starch synthase [Bacteroidia bacterium]
MVNAKKRVLFVSSEMSPFLDESPLANLARMLPQALQERDNEIRVLVPRFGVINERRNRLHEVVRLSGINISIDDNDNPLIIKVASIPKTKMQVYFLDNEDYFHRKAVYSDDDGKFFADNDERTIFFCKGVMETVKKLGWAPDIIHCQGWMTSLIPLYLKTIYKNEPVFRNAKVVYSLYNETAMENLGKDFARKAGLNSLEEAQMGSFNNPDLTNLHIGAVTHADAIVTNGDSIDKELLGHYAEKPTMRHTDEGFEEQYVTFYEQLMSQVN